MGTATALLDWARSQIGVTEDPPGSNRVRYWDDVNMHGAQGSPWCAAFYLAGLLAVGTAPVTRSVWVPGIVLNYKHAGRLFPVADAQPGDQALFRIGKGHTGVVESIDATTRSVTCIEGNTSSDNHGSQDNGGGVFRRTRHWSLVVGAGRPNFAPDTAPGPIQHSEDTDMAMIVLDPKGPDDLGRDSHWEIKGDGSVNNWNGARPLPGLRAVDPGAALPIVAAVLDPSGDGVVLFADDGHRDERGHWVRSTYKILASP